MRTFIVSAFFLLVFHFSISVYAADKYANFADLSAHAAEGDDYTVIVNDRSAKLTVIAIHGGAIEPGSEIMATDIAGNDLNLYEFIAAPKEHSRDLHLTSTHFDEPKALALTAKSDQCVSVHGYLDLEKDGVCVGGADDSLRKKTVLALNSLGLPLTVEEPCVRFGGSAPLNIVNRCAKPGLQLELSTHLRSSHSEWFQQIASAIRGVMGIASIKRQEQMPIAIPTQKKN
jgi:phage replication-related protein YjqB (UPF0714/DUF867 family)